MAGTKAGGKLAAKTNKERHGKNFYQRNGRLGGATPTSKPKGFAAKGSEFAAMCGRKGFEAKAVV
jgi:general stress protein YciG